jgi:phosphatidylserine/phosphatidylglycerophosphate/cardiolipin synthase-like enzyme
MSREIALPDPFDTRKWLTTLSDGPAIKENHAHFWGNDPSTLNSFSTAQFLTVGTGLDIYTSTLLSAIEAAEHEVILVTCFWALSDTLSLLCASLIRLSHKALARRDGSRIRVRLCFSSMSLLQKLLHTSSKRGHGYHPAEWREKLGLPLPSALEGLDLMVRTLFFRPFSVMHPKFVITDRRRAFLPSCNVSWEVWLECCVSVTGPVVDTLIKFWHETWATGDHTDGSPEHQFSPSANLFQQTQSAVSHPTPQSPTARAFPLPTIPTSTILLPSPHHNSLFLSIPLLTPPPPQTPLNTLLLHALGNAEQSIKLITPNLTSTPVISFLLDALSRGVDVHLITNRRMMILEQLVTAGTITEVAVWKLVRKYKQLYRRRHNELEAGRALGSLRIEYFRPIKFQESGPAKVHIKCTVVDGKMVVLGSGNMDRASWYTCQELGIALFREDAVRIVWEGVQGALKRRTEEYFAV